MLKPKQLHPLWLIFLFFAYSIGALSSGTCGKMVWGVYQEEKHKCFCLFPGARRWEGTFWRVRGWRIAAWRISYVKNPWSKGLEGILLIQTALIVFSMEIWPSYQPFPADDELLSHPIQTTLCPLALYLFLCFPHIITWYGQTQEHIRSTQKDLELYSGVTLVPCY